MSDLRDLYQELILDHNRRPRNNRAPAAYDRRVEGYNPLCGDRVTVYLALDGDRVKDVAFEGAGCAISTAAASTMTEAVKGKSLAEVQALFDRMHALVLGKEGAGDQLEELGKLAAFSGVSQYPMRVKCATLAWHTLLACIEGKDESVTTE